MARVGGGAVMVRCVGDNAQLPGPLPGGATKPARSDQLHPGSGGSRGGRGRGSHPPPRWRRARSAPARWPGYMYLLLVTPETLEYRIEAASTQIQ